jgi:hypothetical protein
MNSNVKNSTYDAALDKRALERAKHEESLATLARAERIKTAAAKRVQELERALETATTEQARRLEAQIAAGGPTDTCAPTLSAEAVASELASAKLHAGISGKALASIQSAQAQRQAELRTAEAAVIAAVDGILDSEDIEVARQLSHHLSEAARIGKSLLHATMANEMNQRRDLRKAPPAPVVEALARLDLPLIDRHNTAVNLWRQGDQGAYAQRTARRAALIAGEEFPPVASAAP